MFMLRRCHALVLAAVIAATTLAFGACGADAGSTSLPAARASATAGERVGANAVVATATVAAKPANPDDLGAAATRFANDLIVQNIAGLAGAFTPAGMSKAVAMQAQAPAAMPAGTTFELRPGTPEGGIHPVDIVLTNANGQSTIRTRWKDVNGLWKVDDIGLQP